MVGIASCRSRLGACLACSISAAGIHPLRRTYNLYRTAENKIVTTKIIRDLVVGGERRKHCAALIAREGGQRPARSVRPLSFHFTNTLQENRTRAFNRRSKPHHMACANRGRFAMPCSGLLTLVPPANRWREGALIFENRKRAWLPWTKKIHFSMSPSEEAKSQWRSSVEFFAIRKKFQKLGAGIPKAFLVGPPPGRHAGRAHRRRSRCPFFSIRVGFVEICRVCCLARPRHVRAGQEIRPVHHLYRRN